MYYTISNKFCYYDVTLILILIEQKLGDRDLSHAWLTNFGSDILYTNVITIAAVEHIQIVIL